MISLDTWRKELRVVYDEDRGERRKSPIISNEILRETLPTLKIPGIDKELSPLVFGLSLIHI